MYTASPSVPNQANNPEMDQNHQRALRAHQFHPARPAIIDLFNLYLGRSVRQKSDDSIRELPNKTQKRVTALNRELPPRNEQFLLDFEQLQSQFSDQEQLRALTESVLISLVTQCSGHAPRAEFLLFALRSLCSIGYIYWDSFLPSLLSSVSSAEISVGQGSQPVAAVSSINLSQSGPLLSSSTIPNSSNFQSSNPASPLPSVHGIASPSQSATEPSCVTLLPVKPSDMTCTGQQTTIATNLSVRDNAISSLRQLCCKIVLTGLESYLKPVTHADIFYHMLNWLVNWDQRQQGIDETDGAKSWKPDKALIEWLRSCLDVIWLLVEDDKCRVPFYELLRSGLQFIENIPDDEALFTLILEIHRRRDMMAMHMQMLDQHLHCPSFGTPRLLPQAPTNISCEPVTHMRFSPITYPSVLGEPLHGEMVSHSDVLSLNFLEALIIRIQKWNRLTRVIGCGIPKNQVQTYGDFSSFLGKEILDNYDWGDLNGQRKRVIGCGIPKNQVQTYGDFSSFLGKEILDNYDWGDLNGQRKR
ncbi:unnamed protein product [Ilex paraguariensis]|uniref:Uncharacterized protein n=1 Tax=Ilex paraguariensis TaxID=185542 RepID=A0ABC8TRZ6_9AQUA